MDKTTLLRSAFYDKIKNALDNKNNETYLFRYIMEYRDRNNEILTSPYMLKNMIFSNTDRDVIFKILNITSKEMLAVIKQVPLPGNLTNPMSNFTLFQSILIMIMKYYIDKEEDSTRINIFIFCI